MVEYKKTREKKMIKKKEFLLLLSAMYENGGNTTHRFLDGHPEMFVYPFESQLGTKYVNDFLSSMYPLKYRWPSFLLDATPEQDYKAIIDEEMKVRALTPHVSKFRHMSMDFSNAERFIHYQKYIELMGRSRGNNVMAFFKATFDAWKDYKRTEKQHVYVGYSPVVVIDAEKVLTDLPDAHFLHVVRNPWSAYADTKKRAVPLSLEHYLAGWTQNQYYALLYQDKYPERFHILRTEDIMQDPENTLGDFCEKIGLERSSILGTPTWNSKKIDQIYPWGTIREASPAANKATAEELSEEEHQEIRLRAAQYLEVFRYLDFACVH